MSEQIFIQMSKEEFGSFVGQIIKQELEKLTTKNPEQDLRSQYDDMIALKDAAKLLQYNPTTVGRKFDHQKPGLVPIKRGRDKFYNTDEVFKLRRLLFRNLDSAAG